MPRTYLVLDTVSQVKNNLIAKIEDLLKDDFKQTDKEGKEMVIALPSYQNKRT